MIPRILEAHHLGGYVIRIRFSDGAEGDVDLGSELHGPIFESLKDDYYFRQFRLHPELHTLVWPNGADFAPEFLYSLVRAVA